MLGVLAAAAARWSALLPAYLVFAVIAAVLVVVDAEHHRLPNRLLYPAAAAALVLLAVAAWVRGDWSAYLRAVEAGTVVYVVFLALALISPKSLGMGDVRLAAVLALFRLPQLAAGLRRTVRRVPARRAHRRRAADQRQGDPQDRSPVRAGADRRVTGRAGPPPARVG